MAPSYIYIVLASLIFGLNVAPMFMPPTWTVLVYFYVTFHLAFLPALVVGVIAATLGRVVLAILSRNYFYKLLPKNMNDNYHGLGHFLNNQKHTVILLILIYMFLPVPSNQVFIAAGLAEIDLKVLAGSFFAGRLISYAFWIGTAHIVISSLEGVFRRRFASQAAIVSELFGLAILIGIGMIPWKKILKKKKKAV